MKHELRSKGAGKAFNTLGDLRFYECPLSYITPETIDIMRHVYRTAETNQLPYAGGWGDQPTWFVEAYDIYRQELARTKETTPDG